MTQEDLQDAARRRPFMPFQVVLTTGETFDIRHPELLMVGRRAAIIGIANDPEAAVFDRSIKVDLLHVVGLKDLPAVSTSANGPSA